LNRVKPGSALTIDTRTRDSQDSADRDPPKQCR
jgi:hypothetical protein